MKINLLMQLIMSGDFQVILLEISLEYKCYVINLLLPLQTFIFSVLKHTSFLTVSVLLCQQIDAFLQETFNELNLSLLFDSTAKCNISDAKELEITSPQYATFSFNLTDQVTNECGASTERRRLPSKRMTDIQRNLIFERCIGQLFKK